MDSQEGNSKNKWNKDPEEYLTDTNNISEMFDSGFEMYNNLNKTQEPTNSSKIQLTIQQTMNIFENTTRLVSLVNMFSNNENFEEISTENIKYLLLPALLGILTTKVCGTNNRIHIVDIAEIYFIDFLKRLKSYGLIDIEISEVNKDESKRETATLHKKSNAEIIIDMVNVRNNKIQRYQNQKELEKQLDTLKQNLYNPNIDDEIKRKYFVTLVKVFANQSINELSSLALERPILEHMKNNSQDVDLKNEANEKCSISTKLQPIIITRDAMQKKVFGAGYPSLPILTVQEFYDKKIKSGEWPTQIQRNQIESKNLQNTASGITDENLENDSEDGKEQQIEKDDSEILARARAMDEYKDTHRRGWGNRANRS
ncbi:PREDICTED: immunoglobulin-binding protein 1 [Ceratosolen solmsi marchali]|uniref:Immunoglobulin-binding protein 1 n=1 Tax=Ceratosolen solmsi marchali TaxID=326594 RepID=A0AAJ7E0X7_9HYME|nr:PREDICTED: immunoglobulin-binding protein 1 [Ceratosolen solmsi marchali]